MLWKFLSGNSVKPTHKRCDGLPLKMGLRCKAHARQNALSSEGEIHILTFHLQNLLRWTQFYATCLVRCIPHCRGSCTLSFYVRSQLMTLIQNTLLLTMVFAASCIYLIGLNIISLL